MNVLSVFSDLFKRNCDIGYHGIMGIMRVLYLKETSDEHLQTCILNNTHYLKGLCIRSYPGPYPQHSDWVTPNTDNFLRSGTLGEHS